MISTIIFFSTVIFSLLLYIQIIGSEKEIYTYTGLSYMLPNIITIKNNKLKWTNHHFKIKEESLLTKEILKSYIKQF